MTQENQQGRPVEEEATGYGTPTAEQEMGGIGKAAQPRRDADSGADGLSQDMPDDQASIGAPDLNVVGDEGDDVPLENESTDPGFEQAGDKAAEQDNDWYAGDDGTGTTVPSGDAELDEGNTDDARPETFSSEPGPDATGLPDGSGTDLPDNRSPHDGEDESFSAG
jgi:hypothetical protein